MQTYKYRYINICSVWLNAIVAGPILQQYHKWKRDDKVQKLFLDWGTCDLCPHVIKY